MSDFFDKLKNIKNIFQKEDTPNTPPQKDDANVNKLTTTGDDATTKNAAQNDSVLNTTTNQQNTLVDDKKQQPTDTDNKKDDSALDTTTHQQNTFVDDKKQQPTDTDADNKKDTTTSTDDAKDTVTLATDSTTPTTDNDIKPEIVENEAPININAPQVRLTTSIEDENGYVVGFSIQGRSHIVSGTNCQDYHAYEELAPGWKLAITSDGAGSAREAERGSKANCELTTRLVRQLIESKKWIDNNYFPTELEWYVEIRNIFELIQSIIQGSAAKQAATYTETKQKELAEAEENLNNATTDKQKTKLLKRVNALKEDIQKPLEARDFNATIVLMLITPQGMLTAHIGDGRMGYLDADGNWKALMIPHKGDEASATVFIPNNWNAQRNVPAFTMSGVFLPEVRVVKEIPKAFVLMSDGCESITWRHYAQNTETGKYYDPNEPFAGFFNPLLNEMNEAIDKDTRVNRLIEIINVETSAGRNEQDDRTMIFGVIK